MQRRRENGDRNGPRLGLLVHLSEKPTSRLYKMQTFLSMLSYLRNQYDFLYSLKPSKGQEKVCKPLAPSDQNKSIQLGNMMPLLRVVADRSRRLPGDILLSDLLEDRAQDKLSDDDKSNDKSIYTPQEVLDKLEQAQKKPMAAIQTGNVWTIINEDNLVLETVPEEHIPANVVRVVGVKTEAAVVGKELLDVRSLYICHTLIQEANSLEGVNLKVVDITDQTAITLELKEGLQVLLGDSTALEAQMEALEDVLPIVWNDHGKKADGLLDITGYGDDNPDNDKPVSGEIDKPAAVTAKAVAPTAGDVIKPFSGDKLVYDQTMCDWRTHNGTDFSCTQGDTVFCIRDGKVLDVYEDGLMGHTVTVEHVGGLVSSYSGLSSASAVKKGDTLKMGDAIGTAGGTAIAESNQPYHVHVSVRQDGKYIDVMSLF